MQAVGSLVPVPALNTYLASLSAQKVVLALPAPSIVIEEVTNPSTAETRAEEERSLACCHLRLVETIDF